jgi:hypothetical protein
MDKIPPTDAQVKIAKTLGIDISNDSRNVTAARIRETVEPAINPNSTFWAATQKQIEFATSLGLDVMSDSFWVCSAKIDDKLRELNQVALENLKLKPGDRVIVTTKGKISGQNYERQDEFIVSSIGKNLKVYFKGGGGRSAWPGRIERVEN